MIRVRLTTRSQEAITRGLIVLAELVDKAKKANKAAFLPTTDAEEEIVFLIGDGRDKHGLAGLIGGRQPELDFGGSRDEKLEILDGLEASYGQDELFVAQKLLARAVELQGKLGIRADELLVLLHDAAPELAVAEYNRREVDRQVRELEAEAQRARTPEELAQEQADAAEAQAADELAEKRRKRNGKPLPPTLDEAIAEEDAAKAADGAPPESAPSADEGDEGDLLDGLER